ncbi:MFS transporter [Halioxenophilus sp. WMMB6]|uniref:MFS transporter n=1 Tax=Halioxenophilus sp. WMMB6 TaxID=3073815 RepID=UPI00295E8A96|nr:MFS transporter [Halioxenophilus sp. WMMB6]
MHSPTAADEWRNFWYLPIAAALGYATSVIFVYGFSPFIVPLENEFGWSRREISFGITIASFTNALLCMPIGMLVDKIGPRVVGLLGILLMGVAFALLGTATGSHSNWILLWLGIAFAVLFIQATVWTLAVTSRFTASRGLALAITLCGASVAATIFPPIAQYLISNFGWRMGFIGMGLGWAALVFPVLFFFFKTAKEAKHEPVVGSNPAQKILKGLTIKEGLRSPALYKLLLAGGCFSFTIIGIFVHFVPIMAALKTTGNVASTLSSLIGICSIVGRLGTGFLLDRFKGYAVGGCAFIMPLVGCLLLVVAGNNFICQVIAAMTIGLTLGAEVDVIAYLASKYFGRKNFAALYGALVGALTLGTAFGPLTAGAIYDHFKNYEPFLMISAALLAASAIALFSLAKTPIVDESAATGH